ncbi:katanin-interacting protein-like isoform X3 [Centruroides vittatus]|uniref:katanin-interacting protein-like isoform X3 n=1 Tax=Centruroides vittatus TaxID=120091 RepID=UPI0035108D31
MWINEISKKQTKLLQIYLPFSLYIEYFYLLQGKIRIYQLLKKQKLESEKIGKNFTIYADETNIDNWSDIFYDIGKYQHSCRKSSLDEVIPHYGQHFCNYNLQGKNWKFQSSNNMTESENTVAVDFQDITDAEVKKQSNNIYGKHKMNEDCDSCKSNAKDNDPICAQISSVQSISESEHENILPLMFDISQFSSDCNTDKLFNRDLETPNYNSFSSDSCEVPSKLSQCKRAWMVDNACAEITSAELDLKFENEIFKNQEACNFERRRSSNELYVVDEKEEYENTEHQMLNEDLIKKIVNHIITMDPRKQNTLLKVLGIIENSAADDAPHDSSLKELQQDSNHQNDISTQSSMAGVRERRPFQSANFKKQDLNIRTDNSSFHNLSQSSTAISITFELLSNYGHPKRIGLTEVEFLNPLGDRLEASVAGSRVNDVAGELSNILNGRTKITNQDDMWSCEFPEKSFISLVFTIHLPLTNQKNTNNSYVSAIRIWNYNKDVKELNVGVQRAKIIIGDTVIFDGEFQQGCGNESYDYSQTIYLDPSIQYASRCGFLHKSKHKDNTRNSGKNVTLEYGSEGIIKTKDNLKDETNSLEWLSSSPSLDISRMNSRSSRRQKTTDKQSRERSVSSSYLEEGKIAVHNIKRPMSESLGRKPKWYEDLQQKPPLLNSRTNSVEKPTWLSSKTELQDNYSETRSHSQTSRRNSFETVDFLDFSINKPESPNDSLFDDNVKTPRESSARFGRRAPKSDHADSGYKSERERSHSRVSINDNSQLEDYWMSLHVFEHSHKGRLSMSVDAEGDILDMYMKEEKIKRQHASNDQATNVVHSEMDNVQLVDLDFIIPELPEGQNLTLNILTTWGDKHYVGLNGIEIFCDNGHLVEVEKLWADPADINILPEYSCDPRIITNLIDGVYRTHDDMHLWLAPFTMNSNHYIYMTFKQPVKIAMIRIWNYNKSRIHSYRGARHMEMILDGQPIFKGEIARACGEIQGSTEAFGDTILFTTDEEILEAISHHDNAFNDDNDITTPINLIVERPCTSDPDCSSERPFTAASPSYPVESKKSVDSLPYQEIEKKAYSCTCLLFTLLSGWGDYSEIGLTGIELIGCNGIDMIHLSPEMIRLSSNEPCEKLSRLIDGINVTVNNEHMYLFESKEDHLPCFLIRFNNPVIISGFRIWNYNGSTDDVYKGVKYLSVSLDGHCVSPPEGYLIRKGPGNCHFDFAQEIRFDSMVSPCNVDSLQSLSPRPRKNTDDTISDYESPVMPHGFIFQLQLLSTWGDAYYIGLNGLEMYDINGRKISLTESNIAAYPDSINILKDVNNDVRTPDKLIDGINDTLDGRHMWLAPILPGVLTRVYIIFDYPITISMIKLWNYAKTPTRGVKEFGLLIDDLLVYNGVLAQIRPGFETIPYHTILFTTDREILNKEKNTVVRNQDVDHSVQLTNKTELHTKGSAEIADQALRPTTGVGPACRNRR